MLNNIFQFQTTAKTPVCANDLVYIYRICYSFNQVFSQQSSFVKRLHRNKQLNLIVNIVLTNAPDDLFAGFFLMTFGLMTFGTTPTTPSTTATADFFFYQSKIN